MSDLSDKIDWAILTFNNAVAQKIDKHGNRYKTEEEAIKANLGLLFYIRRIYPGGRFPAWARSQLNVPLDKIEAAGFSFRGGS
jgi:hypothetical protein